MSGAVVGVVSEEGVHRWLAVVAAPREALGQGGAGECEEKQRERGEDVAPTTTAS